MPYSGVSPEIVVPAATGNIGFTSRFEYTAGTFPVLPHSSFPVIFGATLDGYETFNDLGLDGDYATTGTIVPLQGDYHIDAQVTLQSDAPWTAGTVRIFIGDGSSLLAIRTFTLAGTDTSIDIGVSDTRRYKDSNFSFQIGVSLENDEGPSEIFLDSASVAVTKIRGIA